MLGGLIHVAAVSPRLQEQHPANTTVRERERVCWNAAAAVAASALLLQGV
jgi:hypothetical protein